jgi:hypothetical protein
MEMENVTHYNPLPNAWLSTVIAGVLLGIMLAEVLR